MVNKIHKLDDKTIKSSENNKKKILILSNHHSYTYNLRKEIIQRLINEGYMVYLVLPYGEKVELLKKMGCIFIDLPLDRRGMNPLVDLKLLRSYYRIIKEIKPDVVLTYTIKPNIYGGLACRIVGVPQIANVTGLGTAIHNKSIIQKILVKLYNIAFKRTYCIFFQNLANRNYFAQHSIGCKDRYRIIPGSGVNLDDHPFEEYPIDDGTIRFLYIGRIMKDKGIEELVEAASRLKEIYNNLQFDALGSIEDDYKEKAIELMRKGAVNFHGVKDNVHDYIKKSNAVILPSYHEGMANVLLEAASSGRPVLASNIPGCKETFDEGISGFGFEAKNVDSLVKAIIKFVELPYEEKAKMGLAGRTKMEKEFDRNIVVEKYMKVIKSILKEE